MNLPISNNLPIQKLASVFNSTSATYKFYWLLAIIELLEEGYTKQDKRQLFARMISNSWYTVNYFHVSFGKQDNIQMAVENILKFEQLTIDEKKQNLNLRLVGSQFSQWQAKISGTIQQDEQEIVLLNEYGLLEQHYAKW